MKKAGILAALMSLLAPASAAQEAYRTVSSEAFEADRKGAVLVDVREPDEWAQTGMPRGAVGASLSRPDFVEQVLRAVGGDKSKPVAVICRSGSRSKTAATRLAEAGFTNLVNVGDGMIGRADVGKGWLAAGLETRRSEAGE